MESAPAVAAAPAVGIATAIALTSTLLGDTLSTEATGTLTTNPESMRADALLTERSVVVAGSLTDPPVSTAIAAVHMVAATLLAAPPDDPPAVRFDDGKYRASSYGYNRFLTAGGGFGTTGRGPARGSGAGEPPGR